MRSRQARKILHAALFDVRCLRVDVKPIRLRRGYGATKEVEALTGGMNLTRDFRIVQSHHHATIRQSGSDQSTWRLRTPC